MRQILVDKNKVDLLDTKTVALCAVGDGALPTGVSIIEVSNAGIKIGTGMSSNIKQLQWICEAKVFVLNHTIEDGNKILLYVLNAGVSAFKYKKGEHITGLQIVECATFRAVDKSK